MRKTRIALKPYLDKIAGHCETLSNKALVGVIIGLAKSVPTSGRIQFLEIIESYLPGRKPAGDPEADMVEQMLSDIEALKESIEERISAIEDGSYWDEPDNWEDDPYFDEGPDYVSNDHQNALESFFDHAESLFLDDKLKDAGKVYGALFQLIRYINQYSYFSLGYDMDIMEARARYCRCVYETSNADKRPEAFAEAMEIDASVAHRENEYNPDYPLLQDVADTRPGQMPDLESFLPAWKVILAKKETKGRPAVLLLEAVSRIEGMDGVSKIARKWKNKQPHGYLFWLDMLKKENDPQGVIKVGKEGLKALDEGRFRERVAEFIIDAAGELNDAKQLLLGKRERFFSFTSDQNLIHLVSEAVEQNTREKELGKVINYFKSRKKLDGDQKILYVKTLLMAGRLQDAFDMAKKEKSVGWSYHSHAGVVFGSVLALTAGHSEEALTIRNLLRGYANQRSIYSERFTVEDEKGNSFYDEIVKGLKKAESTEAQKVIYLAWADKVGKRRIEHIVSNKYRGAYDRAAQVLGSLAETYTATGQKNKAVKIVHRYYHEKFRRFSAFRREVKAVITNSAMLKNADLLK